jgi:DNA-binding transcriptional regulator YdaS (Cro superfamily)
MEETTYRNLSPADKRRARELLRQACKVFTQKTLAERLGLVQQNLSRWRRTGKIPGEQVMPLMVATDGFIRPHLVRPDLYPPGLVLVAGMRKPLDARLTEAQKLAETELRAAPHGSRVCPKGEISLAKRSNLR